jgi:hypothetical protein
MDEALTLTAKEQLGTLAPTHGCGVHFVIQRVCFQN